MTATDNGGRWLTRFFATPIAFVVKTDYFLVLGSRSHLRNYLRLGLRHALTRPHLGRDRPSGRTLRHVRLGPCPQVGSRRHELQPLEAHEPGRARPLAL